MRFLVALSFAGENRPFVENVSKELSNKIGQEKVLYDKYYEEEFARPNLDTYLMNLYHKESQLIAVFFCNNYAKKEWCGLEWRVIRDLIKKKSDNIMPFRFDDAKIDGLLSIDGYVDVKGKSPKDIANLILKRLNKIQKTPLEISKERDTVEIVIDVDFDQFTKDRETRFLQAIKLILKDSDIKLISKQPFNSTLIILEIETGTANQIVEYANSDAFDEFGIQSIKVNKKTVFEKKQEILQKQVKILAITASPKGSPIFYEKEQDVLLDSVGNFEKEKLFLDIPDPVNATYDEIKKYLKEGKHDVLQITAHGAINDKAEGILVFEDAQGEDMPVTATELANLFEKETTIKIVILSSCHSARPEEYFLTVAKTLYEASVPAVIGMKTSITHFAAFHFNTGFYTALMEGQKIESAFNAGIIAIKEFEEQKKRENPNDIFESETDIPVLMTNDPDLSIADFSDSIIEAPERPKSHTFKTNYMERGFIGRRNIIREILRRVNERQPVISLKGPGGIGKSTLTSRVMADLIREGYDFIEFQGRIEPSGIIDGLVKKAQSNGDKYKNIEEIITNTQELPEKVRRMVELYLSKEKIAIVLDNFEDNQNEKDNTFLNPEMRVFLQELKSDLKNRETFLFFTTRYELPGVTTDTVNVPEFTPLEIKKRFYYGKALSRLDEDSTKLVEETVAKNPRAIDLLNVLLNQRFKEGTITTDNVERSTGKLKRILQTGEHPEDKDFSPFILEDLLNYLTPEQMNFLKAVTIYRKPVKKETLKKQNITIDEDTIEYLDSLSLVECTQTETNCFYYVHRLTTTFLEAHFKAQEKKKLHIKAAYFFVNIRDENNKRYIEDLTEAEYHYKKAAQYDQAFEIMIDVQDYLLMHGFTFEALNMVEEFLHYKLTKKNSSRLLLSYGKLLFSISRYEDALEKFDIAQKIANRIGEKALALSSLHMIGYIHQTIGKYDIALKNHNKVLKIAKQLDNEFQESKSLHHIGMIYLEKGLYDDALEKYEEVLEIKNRIGDVAGEAISLQEIGRVYFYKGLYDYALEKYEESLEIKKRIGDVPGLAITLHAIGIIYEEKGMFNDAIKNYEQALEIHKRIGDLQGEAFSYGQLGQFLKEMKRYNEALDYSTKAYLICKKIQIPNINLAKKDILSLKEYFSPEDFVSILKEKGISLAELEQDGTAPSEEEITRKLTELYISDGEEGFVKMLKKEGATQDQIDKVLPAIKKMVKNKK